MTRRPTPGLPTVLSLPALLLVSLAGCSDSDNPAGPPGTGNAAEVPPNAQVVVFDVVQEVTTEISGIAEHRRSVITDPAEWATLWDEIVTHVMPKPPAPSIDFGSRLVVFATMGERTSGGHTISVIEVAEDEGTLYVVVEEATPGIECMTTDVVTTPAVAVSVPRSSGTVLFVEREIVYPCAPM
jgi:hypothetical protein